MDLLILCGGLATRLGETTAQTPKILIDVAGRPFLDYLLAAYASHFDRILLLAGNHGSQLLPYVTPQLRVVVEPERDWTPAVRVLNVLEECLRTILSRQWRHLFPEHLDLAAPFSTVFGLTRR